MEKWEVARFETKDIMQRDLLAATLAEEGFEAFEETNDELAGYFIAGKFNRESISAILEDIHLSAVPFSIDELENKNWNETWEKNFSPVKIGDRIGVRAPFHEPLGTAIEIVIEPKMSFGTGHHQTTSLMMEQMLSLPLENAAVLDFGSGTGILSVLAEKLNATKIVAIDHEEWAYENATENAARNGCKRVLCLLGNEDTQIEGEFDVILANINRNVILKNIVKWKTYLKQHSVILLSGILVTDERDIHHKMTGLDFIHQKTTEKEGWLCMQYRLS